MTNLKEAREQGKLDQFIKEHEADPEGDKEAFNRAVRAMARKSKAVPKASPQNDHGD